MWSIPDSHLDERTVTWRWVWTANMRIGRRMNAPTRTSIADHGAVLLWALFRFLLPLHPVNLAKMLNNAIQDYQPSGLDSNGFK